MDEALHKHLFAERVGNLILLQLYCRLDRQPIIELVLLLQNDVPID